MKAMSARTAGASLPSDEFALELWANAAAFFAHFAHPPCAGAQHVPDYPDKGNGQQRNYDYANHADGFFKHLVLRPHRRSLPGCPLQEGRGI